MLIFGIHCHQPIGNFDWVFEKAYENSYKKLIEFFYERQDFKVSAHFSGILLEWLLEKKPESFEKLKEMVQRNQLEIIGGGFYEPILSVIPRKDKVLQIEKLNEFVKEHFGTYPDGIWLTERAWDSSVIEIVYDLGMSYIIIDDYHLKSSGIKDVKGYYLTESNYKKINLIPISKELRYFIPFKDVDEVVNKLRTNLVNIIVDDGEKFGIWPGTYELVYEKGWLDNFYKALKRENIETLTIKELLNKEKPTSIAYPSKVSYEEMGQWSLNAEDGALYLEVEEKCPIAKPFLKGGIWENFFVKYFESNYMHKRMLEVSMRAKSKAKEEILKAQCNDAYWHGIFGGIYFPHLRRELWNHIVKADFLSSKKEVLIDEDIDLDGSLEIKIKNKNFILVADEYGNIKEISKYSVGNITNVLTRYKEFYHIKEFHKEGKTIHELSKVLTEREKKYLIFDDKTRFPISENRKFILKDFSNKHIYFETEDGYKVINLLDDKIVLEYDIENDFFVELNFGIHSKMYEKKSFYDDKVELADFINPVSLKLSQKVYGDIYPIITVSQSEKGFDVIQQGVCVKILGGKEKLNIEILC